MVLRAQDYIQVNLVILQIFHHRFRSPLFFFLQPPLPKSFDSRDSKVFAVAAHEFKTTPFSSDLQQAGHQPRPLYSSTALSTAVGVYVVGVMKNQVPAKPRLIPNTFALPKTFSCAAQFHL
jgi:hypothetical protein